MYKHSAKITSIATIRTPSTMEDSTPAAIRSFIEAHLTTEEASRIRDQFSRSFCPNRQVLWTGLNEEIVLAWVKARGFQCLRMAMGPLMDKRNPDCPRRTASPKQWVQYIHGASAIFALKISGGAVVTLLTHPPPERFHPSGATSYHVLEDPIIKGKHGNRSVKKIQIVHPMATKASMDPYMLWPRDEVATWISQHGLGKGKVKWREVSLRQIDGLDRCTATSIKRSSPATATLKVRAQNAVQVQGETKVSPKEERMRLCKLQRRRRRALCVRGKQEMRHLEEKQVLARKSMSKKDAKGMKLHLKHAKEIRNLRKELDNAARRLDSQEVSERNQLKGKHKSQVVKLDKVHLKKVQTTCSKTSAAKQQMPQSVKAHSQTNLITEQQNPWMAVALYTFALLLERNSF